LSRLRSPLLSAGTLLLLLATSLAWDPLPHTHLSSGASWVVILGHAALCITLALAAVFSAREWPARTLGILVGLPALCYLAVLLLFKFGVLNTYAHM